MSKSNWEKFQYLPVSTFILISLVFAITLYFVIKLILNLKQMKKFELQTVTYYENTKKVKILVIFLVSLVTIYLINLGLFIAYLTFFYREWSTQQIVIYYLAESFSLIFLILGIYVLLWTSHFANALIIVVKNQKLILLNETIILADVTKVYHDQKRKYIYINWKDQETKGNIGQAKIKYHYAIKDLLLTLPIPTFFD